MSAAAGCPASTSSAHHLAIGVGLALEGALAVLLEAGGAVAQRLDAGDRSFEGGARLGSLAQAPPRPPGRQFGGPDPRLLPGGETRLGGPGGRVERLPVLAARVAHVGEPQQRVGERTPLAEFVEQDDAALVLRERPIEVALRLVQRPELDLDVGYAGAIAGWSGRSSSARRYSGSAAAYSPREVWRRARKSRIRAMPTACPSCS